MIILHWVTGGGTGATRVALDVALAQRASGHNVHLLLRNKGRPLSPVMQQQADSAGIPIHWIANVWPRFRVIRQLIDVCNHLNPEVFFAHGYSEHLWGRRAAFAASVPVVIHVEHNVERYLPWRVWAARALAGRTHATACVSSGVEANVRRLGLGSPRVLTVHNGVDLSRFRNDTPLLNRRADILMPARFARKKDQPTLIRAVRLLVNRGWQGQLLLAGGGKPVHRRSSERLVNQLKLQSHVQFLGNVNDLPQRLARCRVVALASWQEGLPLVLAEAMAAGCAVVASRIPGITDIVHDQGGEATGWLFEPGNDEQAADVLWQALTQDGEAQRRADAGRRSAEGHFSLDEMAKRYDALLKQINSARS